MKSKPFKILGVQQIAIGAKDKTILEHFFIEMLGISKSGSFQSKQENVRETICLIDNFGSEIELDLMEPIDPELKPKPHQPALNHIGFWVDDLQAAKMQLEEKGVRIAPGGIRKGAAGHDILFIHPRGNEQFPIGSHVLIELVQHPQY